VIGCGKDAFEISGPALGTDHFHFILLIHHQYFQVFVAFQTFEFKYGHFDLLD